MKCIETVDVHSHITLDAVLPSVLSTFGASALSWAVGKEVATLVQANVLWNTSTQRLWSTRTSHSCWLGMAHEIHTYHVSSKCQQVQLTLLPRWCLAIQQPSILVDPRTRWVWLGIGAKLWSSKKAHFGG